MNLFKKPETKNDNRILVDERKDSITSFIKEVSELVDSLNVISKVWPIKTIQDAVDCYRNSETIIRDLAIAREPSYGIIAESNPGFVVPITNELVEVKKRMKGLKDWQMKFVYFNGVSWVSDKEKIENYCDENFRSYIDNQVQKERWELATRIAAFLNSLKAEEVEFILQKGLLYIAYREHNQSSFKPNPAFALRNLTYSNHEFPRPIDLSAGSSGKIIEDEPRTDFSIKYKEPTTKKEIWLRETEKIIKAAERM